MAAAGSYSAVARQHVRISAPPPATAAPSMLTLHPSQTMVRHGSSLSPPPCGGAGSGRLQRQRASPPSTARASRDAGVSARASSTRRSSSSSGSMDYHRRSRSGDLRATRTLRCSIAFALRHSFLAPAARQAAAEGESALIVGGLSGGEPSHITPYITAATIVAGAPMQMHIMTAPHHRHVRPRKVKAKITCVKCGVRVSGEHEFARHYRAKHEEFAERYRVMLHPEHKPNLLFRPIVPMPVPLSECKACRTGKDYGQMHNVAAHLRRCHFKVFPPAKRVREAAPAAAGETAQILAENQAQNQTHNLNRAQTDNLGQSQSYNLNQSQNYNLVGSFNIDEDLGVSSGGGCFPDGHYLEYFYAEKVQARRLNPDSPDNEARWEIGAVTQTEWRNPDRDRDPEKERRKRYWERDQIGRAHGYPNGFPDAPGHAIRYEDSVQVIEEEDLYSGPEVEMLRPFHNIYRGAGFSAGTIMDGGSGGAAADVAGAAAGTAIAGGDNEAAPPSNAAGADTEAAALRNVAAAGIHLGRHSRGTAAEIEPSRHSNVAAAEVHPSRHSRGTAAETETGSWISQFINSEQHQQHRIPVDQEFLDENYFISDRTPPPPQPPQPPRLHSPPFSDYEMPPFTPYPIPDDDHIQRPVRERRKG